MKNGTRHMGQEICCLPPSPPPPPPLLSSCTVLFSSEINTEEVSVVDRTVLGRSDEDATAKARNTVVLHRQYISRDTE